MMSDCAVNLECSLSQTMEYSNDNLFIGKIEKAYASASCVRAKKPDLESVQPLTLYMHDGRYWKLGRCLGQLPDMEKEFGIKRF